MSTEYVSSAEEYLGQTPDGPLPDDYGMNRVNAHNAKIARRIARRKKSDTIDTISTGAVSSDTASTLESTFDEKNADGEGLKDSLLSKQVAAKLRTELALDEITGDWFRCIKGIWKPIAKIRATKTINSTLHKFLIEGFSMSKLNAVEGFLKLYLAVDAWESDKALLPMQNGVLDTKTMALTPYSAAHRFNWQLPYAYDPEAKIKVIRQWLNDATSGDAEIINTIRAFFKITLVGGEVQKFLEIIGPGGTGKSTLIRLLILLIGEANHSATDLKNLEQNRFEPATLYCKHLAVISDSSRYGGEVSVLKAITGGDPVRHERKNQQQSGSFVYGGTVVIASNEAIQSTDYSSGLARRRLPISFVRKITDEDKAKWRPYGGIEKAMQAELPGLLNWVLSMPDAEVADRLSTINGGLSKAQREHLVETNKLAAWIDDNLVLKEGHIHYVGGSPNALKDQYAIEREYGEKLYPNYCRWCVENGFQAIAVQRFTNNLLDIAEHCKLPVKPLTRDANGRRISGFKIRTLGDGAIATPITKTLLSADECRSNVDTTTPKTLENADSVEDVDKTLPDDTEAF